MKSNKKCRSLALVLVAVLVMAAAISVAAFTPAAAGNDTVASADAAVPSVWDGTSRDMTFYSFETSHLYISSANQLSGFAYLVTQGFDFAGYTITLDVDVDLAGNYWYPIEGFAGIFDGNGHTIKNGILNRVGIGNLGFFGTVSKITTIKNLTLENFTSAADSSQVAGKGYGILLGSNTASGTQLINCHLKNAMLTKWGSASTTGGVALLIGESTGSIKIDGCSIVSSAIFETNNTGTPFGAIIGRIQTQNYNSVISNCSIYNTIVTNYKTSGTTRGYIAGQGSSFTISNFHTNMINYCGKFDAFAGRFDISDMGFTDEMINALSVPSGGESIGSAYDRLTAFNNTPIINTSKVTNVTYTDNNPWITSFKIDNVEKYSDIYVGKGHYNTSSNINAITITFPVDVTATATVNGAVVADTNEDAKIVEFAIGDGFKQTAINISIDGMTVNQFNITSGYLDSCVELLVDGIKFMNSPQQLGYSNNTYLFGQNASSTTPSLSIYLNSALPDGLTMRVNGADLAYNVPLNIASTTKSIVISIVSDTADEQIIETRFIDFYSQLFSDNTCVYFNTNEYPWTESDGTWTSGNKGQVSTTSSVNFLVQNISNISLNYSLSCQNQYSWNKDNFTISVDGINALTVSGGIVDWTAFNYALTANETHIISINLTKAATFYNSSAADLAYFKDLVLTQSDGAVAASEPTIPYVNDATYPWTYDEDLGAYKSANQGVSSSSSAITFNLPQCGYIMLDYAVSSEKRYDKLFITLDGTVIVDSLSGYTANDPIWSSLLLTAANFDTTLSSHTLEVKYTKDSSGNYGLDAALIKNLSYGDADDKNIDITYSNSLGTVTNIYNFGDSVLPANEITSVAFGTKIQLWATPAEGYSFVGYKLNDGEIIKSNGDIIQILDNTAIEFVFLPKLIIRDSQLDDFAYMFQQGETTIPETVAKFYGEEVISLYPGTNNLILTAPYLDMGEICSLYVNGVYNKTLAEDNNRFLGTLDNLTTDAKLDFVYTLDGYADITFSYFFTFSFDIYSSLVHENSLPITVINDPTIPYTFDLSRSTEDRLAFIAGNTGALSSASVIALQVTGNGVLFFDYYISSELDDPAIFLINNPSLAFDTDSHALAHLQDSADALLPLSGNSPTQLDAYLRNNPYIGYLGVDYSEGNYINFVNNGEVSQKNSAYSSGNVGWRSWQIAIDTATLGSDINTVYLAFCKGVSELTEVYEDSFAVANVRFVSGKTSLTATSSNVEGATINTNPVLPADNQIWKGSQYTLSADVNEGYQFYGWINVTDPSNILFVSPNTSVIVSPMENCDYKAVVEPIGTYVARLGGNFYTSLVDALAVAGSGDTIYVLDDTSIDGSVNIPKGVTVILPYAANDLTGTAIGTTTTASPNVSWANEAEYLYKTLTINEGATLFVSGHLIVGGVQHYPDQSAQGHTSGAYSQIINNGNISIINCMTVYGLVKGNGLVACADGATLKTPFIVNNYSGGTNTEALYNANQFPFVQFATVNIQCPQNIGYGAKVIGMTSLFFWSSIHTQDVVLIDKFENRGGAEGSLIWMHANSSLTIYYNENAAIKETVGNINLSDSSRSTIHINGEVTCGEFYLQGYGSGDMVLSIPYTYKIDASTGSVVNIPEGRAYKIMPGAQFTSNGTINVDGTLYVYDGLIQADKSGKSYPSSAVLTRNGFSANGVLYIQSNGILNVNGTLAGIVQPLEPGGKIVIAPDATLSAVITEGCAGGYTDNTTTFNLSARGFGLRDTTVIEFEAGKTYIAYDYVQYYVSSFSVTSAARMGYTTETVSNTYNGGWAEKVTEETSTVERTFYIGEAVAGITVNVDGTDYVTDENGKFLATVTFTSDREITYYTKGMDGTKRHTVTLTFGTGYDTLSQVIKSIALDANNNYTRVYNADGTVKTNFVLNANVYYYGTLAYDTIGLAVDTDNTAKYSFLTSLSNEEYSGATFNQELNNATPAIATYLANYAVLVDKSGDEIVDWAKALFAEYTTLTAGKDSAELSFLADYLTDNNVANYANSIVKSAAANGTVTYGDATAYATLTYVDGTTSPSTITKVSYALNGGVINGSFVYNGTYDSIEYSVAVSVANVAQKHLDVTIDNLTSYYGDSIKLLTYSSSSFAVDGDSLSNIIKLTKAEGLDAGQYAITGECVDGRYDVTFVDGVYTITPRDISIYVDNHNDVMLSRTNSISFTTTQSDDKTAKGITYEIKLDEELIATVAANGTVTLATGKAFVAYTTYDVYAVNHDPNYNMVYCDSGFFRVVDDNDYYTVEFAYGKPDGSVYDKTEISVSATVKVSDTNESVSGFTYSITLDGNVVTSIKNVGTYTITVNVTADDLDYTDTFVVEQREVTVLWQAPSFIYNGNDQKAAFSLGNLADGDVVNGVYGTFDCKTAGNHTATITSLSGADSANYKLPAAADCSYNYDIAPYSINVTIADKTSAYGDSLADLTFTTSDTLIGSDILANIVRVSKADGIDADEYAITGECINTNYSVAFTNGTYTITARKITVTIDNLTSVYGEDIKTLTAGVTAGTIVDGDTNVYSLAKEAGNTVKAGGYAITGTCNDDNYDITFNTNAVYVITAYAITVNVNDVTATYGDDAATLSATVAEGFALIGSDAISDIVTLARESGTNAGTYNITAETVTNANYNVSLHYTTINYSVYTIEQREVTVTIDAVNSDNNVTWAELSEKLGYTVTEGNVVNNDDLGIVLSIILSTGTTLSSDNFTANFQGGEHRITGAYDNDNYDVTFVEGTLSVTKPLVSVSGIQTSFTYTGEALGVFDWATNVTGYLASATANSFKATYYFGADETVVDSVVNAGSYKVVVSIVHTYAYDFKSDAVTVYNVTVEQKDISDSISIIGVNNNGIYASVDGVTARTADYEVLLDKVLTKDGTLVATASNLTETGAYVYTATVDDDNYKGSATVAFRIVPDVSGKMTAITEKLDEYGDADDEEKLAKLLEIRNDILALTADDNALIAANNDYTQIINDCQSAWTALLADVKADFDVADKAAHSNLPAALLTIVSAMSAAAWFSFRKFLL